MEETLSTPAPLLKIWEDWGQLRVPASRGRAGYTQLLPGHLWPRPWSPTASHGWLGHQGHQIEWLCWAWEMSVHLVVRDSIRQADLVLWSCFQTPFFFVSSLTIKHRFVFIGGWLALVFWNGRESVGRFGFILACFNHSSSNVLLVYAGADSATLQLP